MTGDEAHDKWVDIDWVREIPGQQPRAMSYNVERCTCTTPWRHYP